MFNRIRKASANLERENAVDLFEFISRINNEFSREEKMAVLQAVWCIIHLGGKPVKHEEHFA